MDVIALVEAGFPAAVAPLGTAVTEDQLALLWRIADEPVVALDGDAAGLRAGLRVVDLALPRLEAGKGLRFALLPGGQDPDDLLREGGAPAMQAVLDAAQPMVRLLWQRETEGRSFDSPERRAALDRALGAAVGAIRDPGLRRHYDAALRDLKWELWGRKPRAPRLPRGPRPPGGWPAEPARPTPQALASALAGEASPDERLRDAVLAILLTTPEILPDFAQEIEALDWTGPQVALRDALAGAAGAGGDPRAAVDAACGPEAVAALLARPHVAVLPAVTHPGDALAARLAVAEALARLQARAGHAAALTEGIEDMAGQPGEWVTRRLAEAAVAVDVTRREEAADTREVIRAPNGLQIDKDEKARADAVLGGIDYGRGGAAPGRDSCAFRTPTP
jgi:DNA primase